jgi:hypothetical protein
MGVPLWAPLAVLIFLASFIPIVGIFFAGAVATLVTLGAKGPIYALIFLGILVVEQQLENHVLQPLIVGRVLHFHPLAIILALAVGGILAGIAGAAVAVPVAAVIYRALPELSASPPRALPPASPHPGPGPTGGPDPDGPDGPDGPGGSSGPGGPGPAGPGPEAPGPAEPAPGPEEPSAGAGKPVNEESPQSKG